VIFAQLDCDLFKASKLCTNAVHILLYLAVNFTASARDSKALDARDLPCASDSAASAGRAPSLATSDDPRLVTSCTHVLVSHLRAAQQLRSGFIAVEKAASAHLSKPRGPSWAVLRFE